MTREESISSAEKIQGWMSREELGWLYDKASEMSNVVEIGSWRGRSTFAIAAACPGVVICVDHFNGSPSEINECHAPAKTEDIYAQFTENTKRFRNISVIREESQKAAKACRHTKFEMVFIDGEHTFESVKSDIEAWRPLATKLFCGHDRNQDGVPKALKECGVDFKEGPGSIWYVEVG